MGIGISIILLAAGAILRFAISVHAKIDGHAVNWHVVGDILMVVGAIGAVIALLATFAAARSSRPISGPGV